MAQDKKSFLLYCDLIHTVKKMPKEDAGELLLTILEYVNDEDPTIENLMVDLVFEPIKQQLKRDLKKYEGKLVQASEAGKRSAESRKQKKLESQRKPTGVQRNSTDVKSRSTDSTVTVTDTVTVIEKEIKEVYPIEKYYSFLTDRISEKTQKRIDEINEKRVVKKEDTKLKVMKLFKQHAIIQDAKFENLNHVISYYDSYLKYNYTPSHKESSTRKRLAFDLDERTEQEINEQNKQHTS